MDDPTLKICVFCGSSSGLDPAFSDAAVELGKLLVHKGLSLVYGGGNIGLMGVLANTMLEHGANVYGVIPDSLFKKEVAHTYLTHQYTVSSMHERKALMNELSDAFIVLPGGYGTLDELFESITWAQLGIHDKPIGLININGYFDPLLEWIKKAVDSGFVKDRNGDLLIVDKDPASCLDEVLRRIG